MKKGDYPCEDCKTKTNPIWWTDNVFWNSVMEEKLGKILCPLCFIKRAEKKYDVVSWRIAPEFKWQKPKTIDRKCL